MAGSGAVGRVEDKVEATAVVARALGGGGVEEVAAEVELVEMAASEKAAGRAVASKAALAGCHRWARTPELAPD